ncbi:nuclear apoptosis-inducing factor 1-like [Cololabis saira]|uniref:nuclear apoptosis-inducing factor 1-like n=1 Tax=Cololabis saira TaxID=129043 RepID=UPI002AD41E9C|nr:nuclear apoptosis-inducing factor 1-like [Cololabis saira]
MGITAENKTRGWAGVAEAVSAVGGSLRDGPGVKKKWADFNSEVKKKGAERKRLINKKGGAERVFVDSLEEKVLDIIGETAVEGVQGGVDTGDPPAVTAGPVISVFTLPADTSSTSSDSDVVLNVVEDFSAEEAQTIEDNLLANILPRALFFQPPPARTKSDTAEMVMLQRELVKEVSAIRKIQEELLCVKKVKDCSGETEMKKKERKEMNKCCFFL